MRRTDSEVQGLLFFSNIFTPAALRVLYSCFPFYSSMKRIAYPTCPTFRGVPAPQYPASWYRQLELYRRRRRQASPRPGSNHYPEDIRLVSRQPSTLDSV